MIPTRKRIPWRAAHLLILIFIGVGCSSAPTRPENPLPFHLAVIPITAIVITGIIGGIVAVVKLISHHRERMAMIDAGMHPDQYKEKGGSEDAEASS